ncbi:MAG: hypothetical protein U0T81_15455 [Saprospiraceae bacterium]
MVIKFGEVRFDNFISPIRILAYHLIAYNIDILGIARYGTKYTLPFGGTYVRDDIEESTVLSESFLCSYTID